MVPERSCVVEEILNDASCILQHLSQIYTGLYLGCHHLTENGRLWRHDFHRTGMYMLVRLMSQKMRHVSAMLQMVTPETDTLILVCLTKELLRFGSPMIV